MKIKVETLAEVILKELSGDVEYERWFGRILPFLKKISELEEKNDALEEKNKELEALKGTELINETLRKENINLLENIHNLRNKIDFLNNEIEYLKKQNEENLKNASKREEQRFLKFQTERENLLKENDILEKDVNKLLEKNDNYMKKISELKNIFGLITKGIPIPLETLYGKIKWIGDLIDSDLSELIELIKTINEGFREKINKLEDTNRKLSGELLNQNEEIHMLEEEIDRLKSENEDLKRLNRQIQEGQK